MADDKAPPLKHYVYERLRTMIDSGLYSKKEVFDALAGELSGNEELAAEAGKLRGYAAKRWNAREAEERTWTERTGNDCMDDAFAALNQAGFVALQNAGWTNTMGWEDAWEECRVRRERGAAPRGAIFYHYQSLERGVVGEGLMLNFGVFHEEDDGDREGNAQVAVEACRILAEHGVAVRWEGDVGTKIEILPFPWRRRRSTTAPPRPGPWRRFHHPDGRAWALRICGATVDLLITPASDDEHQMPAAPIERQRKHADPAAASAAAEALIAEQRTDGFVEDQAP